MVEVRLFVDSRASRLSQLADLEAYALFRKFEKQDWQFCVAMIIREKEIAWLLVR